MEDLFTKLQGKIAIVPIYDSDVRKEFHNYLAKEHPQVKRASFSCPLFDRKRKFQFICCYECDYSKVNLKTYNYGDMDNNQDEYYTGECPKCGDICHFECNYDDWDDVRFVFHHNIVAFSIGATILRDYNNKDGHPGNTCSYNKEAMEELLKKVTLINEPRPRTKKRELQKYITREINGQRNGYVLGDNRTYFAIIPRDLVNLVCGFLS